MASRDSLSDLATTCCHDLFEAYGVELVPAAERTGSGPLHLAGILAFSGETLRGSMMLGATATALAKSNPITGGAQHRSWIAELTNQLVGRFKNRLLNHGVEISIATPAVMNASVLAPDPSSELPPITFECNGELVCVWLDAECDDAFVLAEQIVAVAGLDEGDFMMF
jgi:hypothetical protein